MAITLFDVKKYRSYDFVQETQPTQDGTWLNSDSTSPEYGYSFQVTGGTPTRIEQQQDFIILESIYPTMQNVLDWLNNYFYVNRNTQTSCTYSRAFHDNYNWYWPSVEAGNQFRRYLSEAQEFTFNSNGIITGFQDNAFIVGDFVRVTYTQRNNLIGCVTQQSEGQITVDNPNVRDVVENAFIFYCDIPKMVLSTIAKMINYDVFERDLGDGDLDSETIGNYSYSKSKDYIAIGGLVYPPYMIESIKQYKIVRFKA